MKSYQRIWLEAHPERSESWLKERLLEGFDIHHVDGDRANNDASNLVLIEHSDHMGLHGFNMRRLIGRVPTRAKKAAPKKRSAWRGWKGFRRMES